MVRAIKYVKRHTDGEYYLLECGHLVIKSLNTTSIMNITPGVMIQGAYCEKCHLASGLPNTVEEIARKYWNQDKVKRSFWG